MRSEAAHDKVKEKAILMLKNGKISFDEVSVFFSELSDEEIEEIKSKIMHLVWFVQTEMECRRATMCKMMEDMRNEAAHKAAHDKVKEKAILMLKNGKISFDEISVFFSELSDEEIEEIKSKIMQLA